MSLIAELKRRNVFRMAGLYLVGAWLLVQVASTLFPTFGVPGWALRALVIVLALGFIPALLFAWAFELTPDGIKRDEEIDPAKSIAPQTAHRMNRLIIAALVLALTYFGFDKFVLAPRREAAQMAVVASTAAPAPTAAAQAVVSPGVAVLPFENLSPDPNNAFFAGGVFEEVLTKLSKVPELRVISRTSMEQIAKQHLEVTAIGKQLGVSHVLEGSVRREGDRVRVTVQLIETASDNHIWAENYDRKLDDVFAIQSEIALAIAEQLKIKISTQLQSNLGDRPTKNQAAYDLYLRAVEERRAWRGAATFKAMITLLEPAVELDPDFLMARVRLAEAYGRMYWLSEDPDGRYVAKARAEVDEIQRRWPDRPETLLAQAQLLYSVDRNYEAALAKFRELQEALPGDTAVLGGISSCLKRLDRPKEFLEAARRWMAVDPESQVVLGENVFALTANRRYDEALALAEQAVRKFPEDESSAYGLARLKLSRRGDISSMLEYDRRFSQRSDRDAPSEIAIARLVSGDVQGALAMRAERHSDDPLRRALYDASQADLLQLLGRADEARPLAAQTLATVRASIEKGQPAPAGMQAAWYAQAAAIAQLAGDARQASEWERLAIASPVKGQDEQRQLNQAMADLYRFRGDPETAFKFSLRPVGELFDLTDKQRLAFKPYYDKLYGASPSYRAYMARIAKSP